MADNSSLRQRVFADVVEVLAGINGNPPYITKVGAVYPFDVAVMDSPGHDIYLGVFERQLLVGDSAIKFMKAQDCPVTMTIAIRAIVRGSAESVAEVRRSLEDDIMRALWLNRRRSQSDKPVNTVRINFLEGFAVPEASGGIAGSLALVDITFLIDPSEP